MQATFTDGRTATASLPLQVTSAPRQGVTVTTSGNGTGTVTSNPPGISCPPTCNATFAQGTVVQLTASASTGSSFHGWDSNGACAAASTNQTCQFTMPANAVTASGAFDRVQRLLTVTSTGNGKVSSQPAGIDNCTATCAARFPQGSTVRLTASASSGSSFRSWGAACAAAGTNPACQLTMPASDITVTATFGPAPTGDYNADPAGGDCNYIPDGALGGGDQLSINFRIRPSGTLPPGLVKVRGTSNTGLSTQYNSGASGSAFSVAQFTLRPNDFGRTHVITITVDPDNEVAETNENNNRLRVQVSLPSPRPGSTIDPLPCTISRG